jgi:hypothetical protein
VRLESIRRALVRPTSPAALEALRRGELPEGREMEVYRISEELYETYFQVFNDLERVCGIAGDDFEVEEVEEDRLPCLCRTLKTYSRSKDVVLDEFIDRMWGLCFRAEQAGVAVFFVL